MVEFFPHTRGWSQVFANLKELTAVFPAHAGVILWSISLKGSIRSFSRTRGGDPALCAMLDFQTRFFPHTRGWSCSIRVCAVWVFVFPAHAGVIPVGALALWIITGFSRTRGCDPIVNGQEMTAKVFFPHTRVWSRWYRINALSVRVFPAHAGVIPFDKKPCKSTLSFSRTRGGDPSLGVKGTFDAEFFPHTRGWSYAPKFESRWRIVFPAHAGVILKLQSLKLQVWSFSRTRGCDPGAATFERKVTLFFPHAREIAPPRFATFIFCIVFPTRAGDWLHKMRYKKNIPIENW